MLQKYYFFVTFVFFIDKKVVVWYFLNSYDKKEKGMFKNIKNKIIISLLLIVIFIVPNVYAIESGSIDVLECTEEYKAWLELSDEEKKNTIEPRKYKIEINDGKNVTLLKNSRVATKNVYSLLKSTASYTDKNFNLKNLIANNMKVKNQKQTNTCWTFAAMSSLETNLALKNYYSDKTEKLYDFSERHMAYMMSQSFTDGTNKYGWDKNVSDGGHSIMSTSYLTNGTGAINESDMPFENNEDKISLKDVQDKTVQTTLEDTIVFPDIQPSDMYKYKTDEETRQNVEILKRQMKEHIISSGSINAGIYMPSYLGDDYLKYETSAIYCNSLLNKSNHAVSIVGWNDEYKKENFVTEPSSNGAWIIRNSYGEREEYTIDEFRKEIAKEDERFSTLTDEEIRQLVIDNKGSVEGDKVYWKVGDNGYFYVSYEDYNIYSQLWGIVNAYDEKKYDKLYQHDELGVGNGTGYAFEGTGDTYLANVFTRDSTNTEYLTSVGFDTMYQNGTFEVYVNADDSEKTQEKLKKIELVEGESVNLLNGYHVLNFKKPVKLKGNSFVIVIKIKDVIGEYEYFSYEDSSQSAADPQKGQSYVAKGSSINSLSWIDIADKGDNGNFKGNLCIKGLVKNSIDNPEDISNPDKPDTPDTPDKPDEPDTPDTPEVFEKATASDFSKAKATAELKKFIYKMSTGDFQFEIELKIDNINVADLGDKYEYYYYIAGKKESGTINESKWNKANTKLVKNTNGTYNLVISITDYDTWEDTSDSDEAYLYLKEIVTKGSDTVTTVTEPMEIEALEVDESVINIDFDTNKDSQKGNEDKKDGTTYVGNLPRTGITVVATAFVVLIIIAGITFVRYRSFKDIK